VIIISDISLSQLPFKRHVSNQRFRLNHTTFPTSYLEIILCNKFEFYPIFYSPKLYIFINFRGTVLFIFWLPFISCALRKATRYFALLLYRFCLFNAFVFMSSDAGTFIFRVNLRGRNYFTLLYCDNKRFFPLVRCQ